MKKLAIGISGASGAQLGLKLASHIPESIELHMVISSGAKKVLDSEMAKSLDSELDSLRKKRDFTLYDEYNLSSALASGSFGIEAMAIVPASMNTLAKIANGLSDDLISRAAAIMLKEHRLLLLAPREMPFSTISLRQMSELSALGAIIAPPVAGYYAFRDKVQNLETMEDFFIGKWLDTLGIKNSLYKRWL